MNIKHFKVYDFCGTFIFVRSLYFFIFFYFYIAYIYIYIYNKILFKSNQNKKNVILKLGLYNFLCYNEIVNTLKHNLKCEKKILNHFIHGKIIYDIKKC